MLDLGAAASSRVPAEGRHAPRRWPSARRPRARRRRRTRACARGPCARARPRCRSPCRRHMGATAAIAAATLSGVEPAAEDQRHASSGGCARASQSNVSPVPPRSAGRSRERASSRWKSTWKRSTSRTSPGPATCCGLDHARARAARGLGAVGGPLVAVELQHRRGRCSSRRGDDVVQRRVDEHPAQLGAPLQRGGDPLRLARARSGAGCPRRRSSRAPRRPARPRARRPARFVRPQIFIAACATAQR